MNALEQKPRIIIDEACFVWLADKPSNEMFNKYKDYLKLKMSARWDSERKAWRINPHRMTECARVIESFGYDVMIPSPGTPFVKAKKVVRVRYLERKVRFKCSERCNQFDEIFNNKSGLLSGITEYLTDSYERATTSFYLAKEIITVLEARDYEVKLDDSFKKTYEYWVNREEGFKTMDPDVAGLISSGMSLYQHQNKAIWRIEKAGGVFLLGACMGSGKSAVALAYAAKNHLRVCVVCPKVVRRNWIREAQKFFPHSFRVGIELDKQKRPFDLSGADIISLNYEAVEKWQSDIINAEFHMLVVDESHYCKSYTSQRTKNVIELSKHFEHKLLLSGTAVKNNRDELNPQLTVLDAEEYREGCDLFSLPTGAFWHAIQNVYLAMPKNEVLPFLPKKTVIRHDELVEQPVDLPESIEQIMLFKHECARSKRKITFYTIRNILENSDDAILVFSEFVDICQDIYREFPGVSFYHDGTMTHENREAAKEAFQNPEENRRVFISTRPSLAVGATLTRASHVIFNDLPWTPADIDQASDRVHRIGQEKPVFVYWIIAGNSAFDVRLIDLISQKYELQKAVTEGKQLSKEEQEFLEKPFSMKALLRGAQ